MLLLVLLHVGKLDSAFPITFNSKLLLCLSQVLSGCCIHPVFLVPMQYFVILSISFIWSLLLFVILLDNSLTEFHMSGQDHLIGCNILPTPYLYFVYFVAFTCFPPIVLLNCLLGSAGVLYILFDRENSFSTIWIKSGIFILLLLLSISILQPTYSVSFLRSCF